MGHEQLAGLAETTRVEGQEGVVDEIGHDLFARYAGR
jgi:hypothetical protein